MHCRQNNRISLTRWRASYGSWGSYGRLLSVLPEKGGSRRLKRYFFRLGGGGGRSGPEIAVVGQVSCEDGWPNQLYNLSQQPCDLEGSLACRPTSDRPPARSRTRLSINFASTTPTRRRPPSYRGNISTLGRQPASQPAGVRGPLLPRRAFNISAIGETMRGDAELR